MSCPNPQSPFCIHNPDSLNNVIVIFKRLANAHKNNIGEMLIMTKMIFNMKGLFYYFTRSKISFKTKYTACTKPTSHCTANLCGYACSNLPAFSQQDTLNHILIRQMNEKFFSTI